MDLNNPFNLGPDVAPSILKEFPLFSKKPNGLVPGVVSFIASVCEKATIPKEQVEAVFFKSAAKFQKNLHLPMGPDEAWPIIRGALDEAEAGK